jgi:hypothetical protein
MTTDADAALCNAAISTKAQTLERRLRSPVKQFGKRRDESSQRRSLVERCADALRF